MDKCINYTQPLIFHNCFSILVFSMFESSPCGWIMSFSWFVLKSSRICYPQNVPLWHKDYFELVILRNCRRRRSSEKKSRSYPFVREMYIYKGNIHLCLPLSQEEKVDSKSQENFVSREGTYLNLHNKPYPSFQCFSS